jgi:hypothetical protein
LKDHCLLYVLLNALLHHGTYANVINQAMLDNTNNIYFYRIRSRDAAGRLTGHIVGNGLSTEQDFSCYMKIEYRDQH